MKRARAREFLAIAAASVGLVAACGGRTSRSSPRADASTCQPSVSSGDGSYWVLDEVPATLSVACETARPDVIVLASAELAHDCLEPGPAYAERAGTRVEVRMTAWHHRGVPCHTSSVRTFQRPLTLELTLGASNRLVNALSGSEIVLADIGAGGACTGQTSLGNPCSTECECFPGTHCIAQRAGDCAGTCLIPCGDDLDCGYGSCITETSEFPVCGSGDCLTKDCRVGMTCYCSTPPTACKCEWDDPAPSLHRACATDADCPSPAECVDGGPCGRECGIRCTTGEMRCPLGALCPAAPRLDRPWTCEAIE